MKPNKGEQKKKSIILTIIKYFLVFILIFKKIIEQNN